MDTTRNLARASLTALLFIGAWGASSRAMGEDSKAPGPQGILMKDAYAVGSYCHEKVPAISESSLAGDHPALSAEEKIDSYEPCNQDPLGKDQLTKQRLEISDRKSH